MISPIQSRHEYPQEPIRPFREQPVNYFTFELTLLEYRKLSSTIKQYEFSQCPKTK